MVLSLIGLSLSCLVLDILSIVTCVNIYKVKFQLLDSIYRYTNEIDIADVIKHRQNLC